LAEGHATRLAALQRCITGHGYDVTVCARGDAAWAAWEAARHPLVVVPDDLPGVDGLSLCRQIHRGCAEDPHYVLLLVSQQTPDSLQDALRAGADDILVRPIDDAELGIRLRLAERRIAEVARAREEHRSYMDLLAQAPDLIQTVAFDGQLLYVNRAWCQATGYGASEAGTLSFFDLLEPGQGPAMRKAFRWMRKGRPIRHLQTALLAKDGSVLSVEGSFTPRFRGRTPTSIRVILGDVSRRKRAETMLRNVLEGTSMTTGRDFFRSLVKHLSRALEVKHAFVAERVAGSRTALQTLAVWSGDGFIEDRLLECVPRPSPPASETGLAARGEAFFPGVVFLKETGAESYLGVPVLNAAGISLGALCVLHDGPMRSGPEALRILATFARRAGAEMERQQAEAERRELDRRMQEGQKLESLGVLAGGIAHDFNNLLTSIMGYAGLARAKAPACTPGIEYLADIEKASRRAADLATQMLAYSGKGQFVVEPLDLGDLVEETAALLRSDVNSRGVTVDCVEDEGRHVVRADATQVRQVVMNLVLNASQAMEPDGGTLGVRVRVESVSRVELRRCYVGSDLPAGRYVTLRVRDTGCGMAPKVAARIFDPFFTTKRTGRGLGLAAVVGIVRGHHGALSIETAPGEGTTVSIYLPPTALEVSARSLREAITPLAGDGLLLVVDDEEVVRDLTSDVLTSGGYRVLLACDGQEGVEVFRAHADEIDAVLLDMTMPIMGGPEAFRAMRAIRPNVPVVISSGYTESETVTQFAGDEPTSFIQKPYEAMALLEEMGAVVAAGSTTT